MRFWIIYVLVQISFFGNSERKKEKDQEEIKIELQKKLHRRIHVRDITSWFKPSFPYHFLLLSSSTPSSSQVTYLLNGPYIKRYSVLLWVLFCVMVSWVKGQKHENVFQFNTSWLASLKMQYYFRLSFSFSCSGYDVTFIKSSHT